jgi:TonB family protein
MPSTLLRLAAALLTFGLGITATTLWIAFRTPDVSSKPAMKYIKTHPLPLPPLPTVEEPPPPPSLDEPPPPPLPPRAPVSGGILNGKAASLPQPVYAPMARDARASGTVYVQVTVDESGNVISAKAVSGHPLLQPAAVRAAYQARFAPTRLSGQPVQVSGVIRYNFARQ